MSTGVALPLTDDPDRGLAQLGGAALVEQSIRIILLTAPGERVMRPDFGCRIRDYLFAVPDPATVTAIGAAVEEALTRWEPRIDLTSVNVSEHPDQPRCLLVRVAYRLRATNEPGELVEPIALG